MAQIIAIHSYRRGTGKTHTAANIATMIAAAGRRVGIVDANFQSPSLHVLFRLDERTIGRTLNDYIWGACEIEQTAYDVSGNLGDGTPGAIFLVPASSRRSDITRILAEGFDVGSVNTGLRDLVETLALDVLMIDTSAGLTEETMVALAVSDVLVMLMRPDRQDYLGTGVTVDLARRLSVRRMWMVVNEVPALLDPYAIESEVEQTYRCRVAGVLPHSEDLQAFASEGVFAGTFPGHPLTATFRTIAERLVDEERRA
jgi:MinD-like ATPase involved in chromosome partitioning or flagellar assembly